jgi:hypothetical protein
VLGRNFLSLSYRPTTFPRFHENLTFSTRRPILSFMGALVGFLNEHFQRVRYHRRKPDAGDRFPTELLEQELPSLLIEELVQRRLQSAPLPCPPPDHHPG